ncbi:GMC family oxidoreductase [Microbacterium thalassium]|uniref:Choline dehydrogenase-like flavoprotein n=1 Tax=Microbacterium thalassium TaxID=362649 RepID=A0A7X0FSP8_9MICO|nr:GMC family oxidoreductase N-terminal domain-containing protein [Microbacterium thalassium]MBB6392834.1 choline dehydrogenase-like flavoprotein [Microbacterium thalassium]GLK22935.1 dehydrogenase [Microbacterium thalassium]
MTRTLIVGAGGSGIPLAVRLSEDPDREVILLEAGEADGPTPPELLDASTVQGAMPGHAANWAYPGNLTPDLPYMIARGRILGGSSALNGAYFVRPRPVDCAAWAAQAGPEWSYDALLPAMRAMEADADHPDAAAHGASGPMPISRPPQTGRAARAFTAAAVELGFAREPDKNDSDAPGVGPVPANIVDGCRMSTALTYLDDDARARIDIRGGTRVTRVLIEGGRAIGVETADGVIRADEVVLSAGAIGSAHLLLSSGIGPRAQLEAFGVDVVADLPVGAAFSDHPDIAVGWQAKRAVFDPREAFAFPTALNLDSGAGDAADGDLEVLLSVKPLGYLLTGSTHGLAAGIGHGLRHPIRTLRSLLGASVRRMAEQIHHFHDLQLIVGLQLPAGRGTITLASADPLHPPRIDYRYLEDPGDLARMRVGIRTAVALLRSRAFAGLFDHLTELDDDVLDDDDRLDAWMRGHLGTAIHMCGTAPMGAVVDGHGRVHGIAGLRVADTSILPRVPSRGPFASAVLVGERIAELMRDEPAGDAADGAVPGGARGRSRS